MLPKLVRGCFDEFAHGVLRAARDHEILRLRLLQHEPLGQHVVPCMPPVATRFEISQVQAAVKANGDSRQATGNLAGDERLAAYRRLMVEENAVAGIDAVRFPVVDRNPVRIQLCDTVR